MSEHHYLNTSGFDSSVASFRESVHRLAHIDVTGNLENQTRRIEAAVSQFGAFVERFENAVERLVLDGPNA